PPQFCRDPAVGLSGLLRQRPDDEVRQHPPQPLGISIPTAAVLDPEPQLGEDRQTDADAVTVNDSLSGTFLDTAAAMDVVPSAVGVEQEPSHSHVLRTFSASSKNWAFSISFCARTAARQAASSSVESHPPASTWSMRANKAATPSGVVGQSSSRIPRA